LAFKHFRSCSDEDFRVDRHIHSVWTDGKGSVAQIVEKAKKMHLCQIVITDHVRRQSTYWESYVAEVRTFGGQGDVEVLAGFEAKISDHDGNLDILPACAERADLLIGSVHSLPDGDGFMPPSQVESESLERLEFELSLALLSSGNADVLGHPGGMSLSILGRFDPRYMEGIMQACASSGTAFEINTRYHRGILDWLMEKLTQYDPPVSLGSDAHHPEDVGTCALLMGNRRTKS